VKETAAAHGARSGGRNGRWRGTPASPDEPDREGHGFGNDKKPAV